MVVVLLIVFSFYGLRFRNARKEVTTPSAAMNKPNPIRIKIVPFANGPN
jgi:hypothetical protein